MRAPDFDRGGIYGGRVAADISVIIPVRNDGPHLRETIAAILAQPDEPVREIIIAVGPSTDDSLQIATEIADSDDRIKVVVSPTGQTPASLNLAIDQAVSTYVARVDARSRVPVGYFAHALETIAATGAANVGAIQVPVGASSTQRAIAAAMSSVAGSGRVAYRHTETQMQVDTAWLGFFRRDALIDVGGYDERFVRNQDSELNTRLRKAGHEVWVDGRLRVDYLPRTTLRGLASQYYHYGFWRLRTAATHRSLALRQVMVPAMVLLVTAGLLGALVNPLALVIPAGYAVVVLAACALGQKRLTLAERATMLAALVTMHWCWTAGFLVSAVSSRRWLTQATKGS